MTKKRSNIVRKEKIEQLVPRVYKASGQNENRSKMASNTSNTTAISKPVESPISWSAIIFLIFVAAVLVIAIVLILYFEKLCCFRHHRFLKHFLRFFNRQKTPKASSSNDPNSSVAPATPSKLDDKRKLSIHPSEYLWIAGRPEPLSTFEATPLFISDESGTDLPDDDYTTLVPPIKHPNGNLRKLPTIPITVDNGDENAAATAGKSVPIQDDRGRTIITGISRHQSTKESDSQEQTRSAPPSPALLHSSKQRAARNAKNIEQNDADIKSVSSDQSSIFTNGNPIGTLEVRLKFDAKNSKMWVFVIKANLDAQQQVSKQALIQVHLTMLPNKRTRFRTRVKPIENAMFAEEFFCKVVSENIQSQGIRFRLYTNERFKRERLLAEASVMFGAVNLDEDMCKIIPLERPHLNDDSDQGGQQSRTSSNTQLKPPLTVSNKGTTNSLLPEIEIGLAYDKNQSTLILEIGKGNNFSMSTSGRAPDTYAQITLLNSSGQEIVSNRTVTRPAQHHPIFAERYPLNIQENLLDQITLAITIVNKRATAKTERNIGWISFGHGASGNAQVAHWDSMLNAQGETITRWHALLES